MIVSTRLVEPRPYKRAALWLLALGVLFFSSYNAANWLAAQHAYVPAMVFTWETGMPYWPWTIVPYWSIDVFYCVSLFICATRRELDTHARRLLAAQLISVTCFVMLPLRYTFERPETSGLFGAMFDILLAFDRPYNQAPALHISLLVILWVRYAQHLAGVWRWLLHVWFTLIGISVLTTYQHHFFDVPTGAWVGWFCVWLFPDGSRSLIGALSYTHDARRRQIAARYLAGAVATGVAAVFIGGAALWLMWVAAALLLVSLIYAFLDASAFQKDPQGRMSAASRVLLAPYLLGAWLNTLWWTRHAPAVNAVMPGIWIGRLPHRAADVPAGVRTLIDLCAELPCLPSSAAHVHFPLLDLVPLTTDQLEHVSQEIARAVTCGPVLVCCAIGYSRSAAAVAAWLITSGHAANASEAVARIREARPHIVLGEPQCQALDKLALTYHRR